MNSIDLQNVMEPSVLAKEIAHLWDKWKTDRVFWEEESAAIRQMVFAATINTTANSENMTNNRTTIPKAAQIYDNLLANYDASIFPNPEWFKFEANSKEASNDQKRKVIQNYMKTKTRQSKFRSLIRDELSDWILYGNCFVGADFVREYTIDPVTDEKVIGYIGPKAYRISPHDIVFDITATSFDTAPKIIRTLKTLGQIIKEIDTKPELGYTLEMVDRIKKRRSSLVHGSPDIHKIKGLLADGFSSLSEYYKSGVVEILEFFGDLYILESGDFKPNHAITVVDRADIIRDAPVKSYNGNHGIFHSPWRKRPDSLMGMSPLLNLEGMQYRVDKVENTKADIFDLFAHPIIHEKGDVEFIDGEGTVNGVRGLPGSLYRSDADGDVQFLQPNPAALNADFQIQNYLILMEEMAGAPKNTMGIRTPGEKTAFEVQTLDNAASRIFQNKSAYLEEEFIEPLLNYMLELSQRNLDAEDYIKVTDDKFGVDTFISITADDISAAGKIYAIGSRVFAAQAILAQNLTTYTQSPLYQDTKQHLDTFKAAQVVEKLLGLEQFELFRDNVGVEQQVETQRLIQQGQDTLAAEQQTPSSGAMPDEITNPPA